MKYFVPASLALVAVIVLLMYLPSVSLNCPSYSKESKKLSTDEIKGLPLVS